MTKQEREINELITTAEHSVEQIRSLYRALCQHDPRRKIRDPPSLATLAADAGQIAYRIANLRVDIIRTHERRQKDAYTKTF